MSVDGRRVLGYKLLGYLNPNPLYPAPLVALVEADGDQPLLIYPNGFEESADIGSDLGQWAEENGVCLLNSAIDLRLEYGDFLYGVSNDDILVGTQSDISKNIALRLGTWQGESIDGLHLARFIKSERIQEAFSAKVRAELADDPEELRVWDSIQRVRMPIEADDEFGEHDPDLERVEPSEFLARVRRGAVISGIEVYGGIFPSAGPR